MKKIKKLNNQGFTLVEIMIVVAIIALLAAIAIPNLISAKRTANEAAAKATVRTIATSAETFATANDGSYPAAETDLTTGNPAYLSESICGTTKSGYVFACTLAVGGYTITATPVSANTGTKTFTGATGAVITSN